jgi:hypothetical protein
MLCSLYCGSPIPRSIYGWCMYLCLIYDRVLYAYVTSYVGSHGMDYRAADGLYDYIFLHLA